jgi:MoxR-like ATPase
MAIPELPRSRIFRADATQPHAGIDDLPEPPPWRQFTDKARTERGAKYHIVDEVAEVVNAALFLRRPILVTGKPGTGKSSLAFAVAWQLGLGRVLQWSITTRSTLQQGLYTYDALARLQDASLAQAPQARGARPSHSAPHIGNYIRLGPLGTAMLPGIVPRGRGKGPRPRVLLIDEIDKSDIDLPNDLLNIFEEGEFEIPELTRLPKGSKFDTVPVRPYDSEEPVEIARGRVRATTFPFVVMTSNGEREFPPAFIRRCLRLDVKPPSPDQLAEIVRDRLHPADAHTEPIEALRKEFVTRREDKKAEVSTDQLLNAAYLVMNGLDPSKREALQATLFRSLSESQ